MDRRNPHREAVEMVDRPTAVAEEDRMVEAVAAAILSNSAA